MTNAQSTLSIVILLGVLFVLVIIVTVFLGLFVKILIAAIVLWLAYRLILRAYAAFFKQSFIPK
ncbi:MAG TPA: hypothetical protein VJJ82_04500 [Candidatus Nanoarchaeia archaeon]|nr:hypothetical protein [Candidatus Nanoarchaeia archaeon]